MRGVYWIAGLALAASASAALAQAKYPVKPVRMLVGFAPGGATDIIARAVGPALGESLGQTVIIENRPGASSQIAGELVAKAPPDGHVLLFTTQTLMTSMMIEKKAYPDFIRDFTPVTLAATGVLILVVNPALPVKSVKDLLALARARPGDLTYASGGAGSTPHLAGELMATMAHLKVVHVPYKGEAPGIIDVIAGHVPVMFCNVSACLSFVQSGRLRAIAVTSLKPSAAVPGLPAMAESGLPGFEVIGFWGVLGPAGLPRDVATRLSGEINKVLARPDIRDRFASQALDPAHTTPEQFGEFIKTEVGRWGKLIREAGITVK
jgi:tripartite-type tricarboxylate transporter receptor subunit TctC